MTEQQLLKKYKAKIASTRGRFDKLGNPIEFKLTFEQYVKLWEDFGRPPGMPYVISRKNDIGHYEIGNVYIQHNINNLTETFAKDFDTDQRITRYCIATGYKRRIVRAMLKRGDIIV